MINGTPVPMLVNDLDRALQRYQKDPSKENLMSLQFACFKVFEKGMIDNGGGIQKTLENMENGFKFQDAFKHFNNLQ